MSRAATAAFILRQKDVVASIILCARRNRSRNRSLAFEIWAGDGRRGAASSKMSL